MGRSKGFSVHHLRESKVNIHAASGVSYYWYTFNLENLCISNKFSLIYLSFGAYLRETRNIAF
jgi:uncharacterized RmlC-like cupin family protein